jgi:hypothetical protein
MNELVESVGLCFNIGGAFVKWSGTLKLVTLTKGERMRRELSRWARAEMNS